MPADPVEKSGPRRVLFVCTGNTCRSPMAEALCKRLLAERLGCAPAELPDRGFLVQSAGLSTMSGAPASPDAVAAVSALGADLSSHCSQPLTLELLLADHIFAMTHSHLELLSGLGLSGMPTPQLLSPEGSDVFDPIGSEPEVYRACAEAIWAHLQKRLPEILA
jgi:protein-tyrosine phosphatase